MGISYGGISQLFVGADPAAEPRGDHAAVADRPDADDALSRAASSTPASRSSGPRTASTTPSRRPRTTARTGPTSRSRRATRSARRTRSCTPRRSTCSARSGATPLYKPKVADPLSPVTFVDKINVPTFVACQWEDEQTGGHCPTLASRMHRHRQEVVHVHQRHPHRLARPVDLQPLVRLPRPLRRASENRT